MRVRHLFVALVLLVAARVAGAQRVSGIVRDTTSSEPLAGVVVSLLDSTSAPVGRALTDAAGRYSLLRPVSAHFIRVMRIGYQPRLFGLPSRIESGESVDIAMRKVATLLSTIVVNDDRVCSSDKDGTGAMSLWEQARAGLMTAVVAREQMPARASLASYERVLDAGDARLLRQTMRYMSGQTSRPFVAGRSPSDLARRGYLLPQPGGNHILAPDADVLLDDTFAATHCFSVKERDVAHPGLVGLAFEPIKGRDSLLDVRGTLWLESGVPSLFSLEFQYAGRLADTDLKGGDGWIHFKAMPNGVVFVDQWQLRLPVLQRRFDGRGALITRLVQHTESGGIVLQARWPDSSHWETKLPPLTGVVRERGSAASVAGALVTLEATSDTVVTDSTGQFAIHPVIPGRYVIVAIDTSFTGFVKPRSVSQNLDVVLGRPRPVTIDVGTRADAVKQLCEGVDARAVTSTIIGRLTDASSGAPVPRDLRLTARWLLAGVAGAVVSAKTEYETVDPDEEGRFSFCGVPRDRPIRISATRPSIEYADTVVVIDPAAATMSLGWWLDLRTLAQLTPPRPTVLRGRVVRAGTSRPVSGADIWLPALDRRVTTDSAGAFRLDSLPAGPQYVQVRRVGFAVLRDTLSIAASTELRRDFAIIAQSQMLDTMRTVASSGDYISPLLRGFEARRANAASGYFVTDSVLRLLDNSSIANMITSRVSGLTLAPGSRGTYLVSTRKTCPGSALSCVGPPRCYVTIYIDGILFYSATNGSPPDASRLMVNQFAAIEFYPSSATGPPQYNGTDTGCGVLLLWTRER